LDRYDEINYWKAAALAGVEDWQQADKVMPTKFLTLEEYPKHIKQPLTLALTEVALRAGNVYIAEQLLSGIQDDYPEMSIARQSAWKYLQGEMERQSGNPEQALKNWEQLLTGKDDYHRAKAGLSVTRMQLERQKITPSKAIDRLEGLRYAWRGDELETVINYRLGQVYIENDDYLKGLGVLRNAVGLSPDSKVSQEVADYMTDTFRRLFTDGTLEMVSPLDAISIYDEFKELTPTGEQGNVFVQNLAERLVNAELLGRAAALLEDQMKFRLKGVPQAKVGVRLAAIRLIDNQPKGALEALDVATKALRGVGGETALKNEIKMLRARSYSKTGEANRALRLLQGLPNNLKLAKLRADIAWNGGLWGDAAKAFKALMDYEAISKTRPMNEYQENLVLNYSIALNLSGDRSSLAKLRTRFGDLMNQSEKARIFNLVTRPRQLGLVEDRESIMSLISEVNLFGEFLESYRKSS
jgi:predicted negative regulator of RcsB-dependent stress response